MKDVIIKQEDYAKACKEVLEILKTIKQDDLNKIPAEEIDKIKENADYNYNFTYELDENKKNQNVSKLAKAIIANFYIDYIASPEKKKRILDKQKLDIVRLEEEKRKKYDSSNILKNKKQVIEINTQESNLPANRSKITFLNKIFNFVRKIFKIK